MVNPPINPTVSVVSPFYNRARFLPAIIDTLEAQTYRDFELVIADDGSTDELAEAVAKANASFPIQYVRLDKNGGAAHARNIGIDAARGRYIALLDSDDGWLPDKLRTQLDHLKQTDEGRLVSLTRQTVKGRGTHLAPTALMTPQDDVGSYLFLQNGVIQSSMMFLSTDLAKSTRFDDESTRHDDWSFALRLQEAGARFEMLAAPLTIYNDEAGRMRRSPPYSRSRLDWLQKWRRHLGEAPYFAAAAAVASHLRFDWQALPIIARAMRKGAISPIRAVYYALAWGFPPVRTWTVAFHHFWFAQLPKIPMHHRELS